MLRWGSNQIHCYVFACCEPQRGVGDISEVIIYAHTCDLIPGFTCGLATTRSMRAVKLASRTQCQFLMLPDSPMSAAQSTESLSLC
jgi:hypothetical protein